MLLELGRNFESVAAATRATELAPEWAPGLLTLGRAQLNFGELDLAEATLSLAAAAARATSAREETEEAEEELTRVKMLLARRTEIVAEQEAGEVAFSRAAGGGYLTRPPPLMSPQMPASVAELPATESEGTEPGDVCHP